MFTSERAYNDFEVVAHDSLPARLQLALLCRRDGAPCSSTNETSSLIIHFTVTNVIEQSSSTQFMNGNKVKHE